MFKTIDFFSQGLHILKLPDYIFKTSEPLAEMWNRRSFDRETESRRNEMSHRVGVGFRSRAIFSFFLFWAKENF